CTHRRARRCSARSRSRLRWPPGRRWWVGAPGPRAAGLRGPGVPHCRMTGAPWALSGLVHGPRDRKFSRRRVDAVRARRCQAAWPPERTTRRGRGAHLIGPPSAYIERMRGWLEQGRYEAAAARRGDDVLAYVLWRDDPDYGDIFVRQFFVSRGHQGAG